MTNPRKGTTMLDSLRKMFVAPAPSSNHRRWQRLLMSEPARMIRRGESHPAMLDEICAGGARVKSSQRLAPGAVIDIGFKTGLRDHHSLSARVVHAQKDDGFAWRYGLCFVDAGPSEIRKLNEYVEEESKRRETGFATPRA